MYKQIGKTYRARAEENTPRVNIVSRMFEVAIDGLDAAIEASADGRIEDRHIATSRVSNILMLLRQHLDFDQGLEIASNLDRLYAYCMSQLVTFEMRNDPAMASQVRSILKPLCDAWQQLANEVPAEQEASSQPARAAISA